MKWSFGSYVQYLEFAIVIFHMFHFGIHNFYVIFHMFHFGIHNFYVIICITGLRSYIAPYEK